MRRGLLSILGVAGVALALTVSAGADQSYTDPNGDGQSGTDIVAVTVRNDAAGAISIQVQSASQVVANHAIAIFIDADRNQATGGDGDEYWMFGGPLVGAAFMAWNGSGFSETDPASFSAWLVNTNITEFRFNKADIGNVSGFNFLVVSISIDPPNINFWDYAPDNGEWTYTLASPTTTTTTTTTTPPPPPPAPPAVVKPVIGTAVATPLRAVAGKRLTVAFRVTRSDNGKPLTTGKMVCNPTIAGKIVPHTDSFTAGTARLSLLVPKTAKGKVLTVRLAITTGKQSATRVVTFRIG
jgi:hypothetical protein